MILKAQSPLRLHNLGLGLLASSGVAVILFATSQWGVGVNGDTVTYVDTARNLLSGRGLLMFSHQCNYVPATRFAPLYPFLLAAPGAFGFDLFETARWLNAILFGANIFLVGKILSRCALESFWLPLLGAFLFATSPDLIMIHSMGWTEPFFILCALLALVLLTRFIQESNRVYLFASAGLTAIAFLTRFVGASLVVAGVAAILLLSHERYRVRMCDAAIFGLISVLPLAGWTVGNSLRGIPISEARGIAFHPITLDNLLYGMATMAEWVFPESILMRFGLSFLGVFSALLVLNNFHEWKKEIPVLLAVFAIFLLVYGAFIVIAISAFDASTLLEPRIMAPAHVVTLILLLALAYRLHAKPGLPRPIRFILIAMALLLAGMSLGRAAGAALEIYSTGQEFSSKPWRQSTLFEWIRQSNPQIRIYSNADEVIYYLTGRQACRLPVLYNEKTFVTNPNYSAELASMANELKRGSAAIVYLSGRDYRVYVPTPDEMERLVPLLIILQTPQGTIYRARDPN